MVFTRRDVLQSLAAAGMGALAGVGVHGFAYETRDLRVARATLPVAGLAPEHDGLRVGLLTDVHHSAFVSLEQVAEAVDRLLTERPDLILLGGDYVTNFDTRFVHPCVEVLSRLEAPHGVFAAVGNHDDERQTRRAFAARDIPVLTDARTSLVIRGEPIDLMGIRFWTRDVGTIAALARGARGPALLLAHDPRRLQQAIQLAIPLVLSGHTHGGQVVLPVGGAIAASRFPVVAGAAERGGTTLFVSRGIGTVIVPLRINCPPDVAVLTLTPRAPADTPPT